MIPKWLLDRMEINVSQKHSSTETNHSDEVVSKRSIGAHAVRFNKICEECNGGWLSELEQSTKPILEQFLSSSSGLLTSSDSSILTKWMFKTNALLHLTLTSERQHLISSDDLKQFYKTQQPTGQVDLFVYSQRPASKEKISIFLPRTIYEIPVAIDEEEAGKLKCCFASYMQLKNVLFRFIYRNPPNVWEVIEASKLPIGQRIWPSSEPIAWKIYPQSLPTLDNREYAVMLRLVEPLRNRWVAKDEAPSAG